MPDGAKTPPPTRAGPDGRRDDAPAPSHAGDDGAKQGGSPPLELVIFVGLQATGKSTFFRTRFAGTHEHVSKDLFPNNRDRNRRQRQLIEDALGAGLPAVVDNTNPTVEERAVLIELGRELGARICGYHFESEVRRCVARNRRRTGKARVPDVAIFATAKRLEPPSLSEGFDELFCVRITGDSGFEVLPCAGGRGSGSG